MSDPEQPIKPTGERFFMREATPGLNFLKHGAEKARQHFWHVLRETIESRGGEVISDKVMAPIHSKMRTAMFVRDPGFILHVGDRAFFSTSDRSDNAGMFEAGQVARRLAKEGIPRVTMPGAMDGGDVVYDQHHNTLFVGISNQKLANFNMDAMREKLNQWAEEAGVDAPKRFYMHEMVPPDQQKDFHQMRLKLAKPQRTWLEDARERFNHRPEMKRNGLPFQVVPIFIDDRYAQDVYHLDGAFNVLPTGQAVVFKQALGKAAYGQIERIFGAENIIEVNERSAMDGATNFITVGKSVIVPYAPESMKEKLQEWGYEVITPETVGLPRGAWKLADGAGPRCATLKLTLDKDFPEISQERESPRR